MASKSLAFVRFGALAILGTVLSRQSLDAEALCDQRMCGQVDGHPGCVETPGVNSTCTASYNTGGTTQSWHCSSRACTWQEVYS
jgi:hypothetical protein